MKKDEALYQGVKVSPEDLKKILREYGYPDKVLRNIKEEAHMTCDFKPEVFWGNNILGRSVKLHIVAVGELEKKGLIKNIGLLVDDKDHLSSNSVPHITCWISEDGKAVETAKCRWIHKADVTIEGTLAVFDGCNRWAYSLE